MEDNDNPFFTLIHPSELFSEREREEERKANEERKEKRRLEMMAILASNNPGTLIKSTHKEKAKKKFEKAKMKRKNARENAKKRRFDMLYNMTKEERIQFINDENTKDERINEKLSKGMLEGTDICIDCGFEAYMVFKEVKSLASQLNFVYGRIKESENLFHLHITNFKGKIAEIGKNSNQLSWKASFKEENLQELIDANIFGNKEIIYLSPDADEELESFEKDKVYIIGGLVDGAPSLNKTKEAAKSLGVRSMKLPLDEIRKEVKFRPCLNINTVFNIIDDYFICEDMRESILKNLPMRFKTGKTKASKKEAKLNNLDK